MIVGGKEEGMMLDNTGDNSKDDPQQETRDREEGLLCCHLHAFPLVRGYRPRALP